ncbi:MAG: ABC transporter permease [Planctomycetes bacterium]|nr:ABC transporter permease [Planctomycetota bacterium]
MPKRIFHLTGIELYKLAHQPLAYAVFALALAVTALTALVSAPSATSGYHALARAWHYGTQAGALALLLLGSLSMSSETTQGTLRLLLTRPIHRGELYLAKACALLLVAGLLQAAIVGGGAALVGVARGYGDVVDPQYHKYVYFTNAEMMRYSLQAAALGLLSLMAVALLGLAVSTLVENAGVAVALAILLYVPLGMVPELARLSGIWIDMRLHAGRTADLLGVLARTLGLWVLNPHVEYPFEALQQLGEGIANARSRLRWENVRWEILVPATYMVVTSAVGVLHFRRKDVLV